MGRLLFNRFTKFGILTTILAVVSLGLGAGTWTSDGIRTLLIILAIVLFLSAVGLEFLGFSKAKHFSQDRAQKIYERVRHLILELREMAPVLHKEYGGNGETESRWKYNRDKRYRELLRKFDEAMGDCDDRILAKKLQALIENEKMLARRGINLNSRTLRFPQTLEMAEPEIRTYISTNIKGQ